MVKTLNEAINEAIRVARSPVVVGNYKLEERQMGCGINVLMAIGAFSGSSEQGCMGNGDRVVDDGTRNRRVDLAKLAEVGVIALGQGTRENYDAFVRGRKHIAQSLGEALGVRR